MANLKKQRFLRNKRVAEKAVAIWWQKYRNRQKVPPGDSAKFLGKIFGKTGK